MLCSDIPQKIDREILQRATIIHHDTIPVPIKYARNGCQDLVLFGKAVLLDRYEAV
jgi:hypothetical protein